MRLAAYGVQTEKGTLPSAYEYIPNVTSINLTPDVGVLIEHVITDRLTVVAGPGGIKAGGRIETVISTTNLKQLLDALFLKEPSDAGDGSTYHVWQYSPWNTGDTLRYFTFAQMWDSGHGLVVGDAAVNSLELRFEGNELARATADVIGGLVQTDTVTASGTYTESAWGFHHVTMLTIDLTPVKATSARITFENNIADDYFILGSRNLADILPGEFNVEIELNLKPPDFNALSKYLNQPDPVVVTVTVEKDSNNKLEIGGSAYITSWESEISGGEYPSSRVRLRIAQNLTVKLTQPY